MSHFDAAKNVHEYLYEFLHVILYVVLLHVIDRQVRSALARLQLHFLKAICLFLLIKALPRVLSEFDAVK